MLHQQFELLNDAQPLVKKYDKRINAVAKATGNLSDYEAASMAIWLNNSEKMLNNYRMRKNMSDMTYSEVVGPFKKHMMNIISTMYSTFDLKDIISIQPMSQKIAAIYYLSYTYGSNKGNVAQGNVISAPNQPPTRTGYYSSQIVKEETIALVYSAASTASLAYFPLNSPASISLVIVGGSGAGTYTYLSTGTGVYNLQKNGGGITVGTINYTTGLLSITGNITVGITSQKITYSWNSEKYSTQAPIPRVTIGVQEILTTATRQQLLFDIMLDATYDFDQQFGRDLNAELETTIIREIQNETAYFVLDRLYNEATGNQGTTFTFELYPQGYQVSYSQHLERFFKKLAEMSMKIYNNLGRGQGNFIVAGSKLIEALEPLPETIWKRYPIINTRGPYKVGRLLGKYDIYFNPVYPRMEFIMGFKGEDWWEAPYFMGVYLPLMSSKFMMFPDMHGEQGYISMNAHEYLFPLHVVKGILTESMTS